MTEVPELDLLQIDDEPVTELAPDLVPTLDQNVPVGTYKDWKAEDTKVVCYSIGNTLYPGKYAESRDAARADCQLIHGRIFEANYVQGRAFFRVAKVK